MGLLGSTVYMTRGFYQSVVQKDTDKKFNFVWIWWYLCRPFLGLISGAIIFLIAYTLFDLEQTTKNKMLFGLFAFLAGFNFHDFIEKKITKKIDII